MTKIGMISLGCSKNRVDAEMMLRALKENGFAKVNTVQLSVARSRKIGSYTMMTGQNPVFIIRGEREERDGE